MIGNTVATKCNTSSPFLLAGGAVGLGGCTEGAAGLVCCTEGVADVAVGMVADLVEGVVADDEVLVIVYCSTLGVTDDVTTGDTGYLNQYKFL